MMKQTLGWLLGVLAVLAVLLVSGCIHAEMGNMR